MSSFDRIIRSRRVVTPSGVKPASILIADGAIVEIVGHDDARIPAASEIDGLIDDLIHDLGDAVVMPGLVDTHVHVNEPGRAEWEGYATATRAAAAGGITTLIDMPLNSIPATTSRDALAAKRATAEGKCFIDVGFWGGVVPGNRDQLGALIDAGVMGFKCFLCDSGVDEFASVGEGEVRAALHILGEAGVPLLAHAELPEPLARAALETAARDPRHYATYLDSRPPAAEEQAIALLAALCRETRAPVHVVHHSAATAIPIVEAARNDGLPLTAETCPHYLHFAAETIPDGATEFKCAPPIRSGDNRELLWQALSKGVLGMVVSDHSPCTVALKGREAGDFLSAWGGVASLQLTLPITWTGASRRGYGLVEMTRWMCEEPARLAGLAGKKGVLAPGADADLAVWQPDAEFVVDVATLGHKNKITPYHGETLHGAVARTYLRGELIYDTGAHLGPPRGHLLTR